MRALSLLLLFALAPIMARAADVTIKCDPPTQFTDGTPIPAGAVITYKLYAGSLLDTQPACQFVRKGLAANTYNYTATASVAGVESDPSSPVQVVVPPPVAPAPKPSPPGTPAATVVTTSQTAYTTVRSAGRYVALPVGSVPLGASCDVTQPVLGLYVLTDPKQVTFTGTTRTIAPLGSCT